MDAEARTSDSGPVALSAVMSFSAFYHGEYRSLVALAWSLTGSREAGEDIAQEAMLSLHRKWEAGEQVDNPAGYVRRACANLAVSWIRRRVAEARTVLRLRSQPDATSQVDPDTHTFWSEVRRLPRRQAQVLALYYGYDMTVAEVSETLQLSAGSTKTHLHRGRLALAKRLGVSATGDANDGEGG